MILLNIAKVMTIFCASSLLKSTSVYLQSLGIILNWWSYLCIAKLTRNYPPTPRIKTHLSFLYNDEKRELGFG